MKLTWHVFESKETHKYPLIIEINSTHCCVNSYLADFRSISSSNVLIFIEHCIVLGVSINSLYGVVRASFDLPEQLISK